METPIIHQTMDYDMFVTITGNRTISASKIAKLRTDIESGFNMLSFCPIIVSPSGSQFVIIDGQHRYEASKVTNNPVSYVVCKSMSLYQIALLNSRGDKWTVSNFLQAYITAGLEDYVILRQTVSRYGIPVKLAANLLMTMQVKGDTTEAFQTGRFKVGYLEETNSLMDLVLMLFGRYTFFKDAKLIAAVKKIKEAGKCDFVRLCEKIKAAPNMMDSQTDVKNYIYNIERVYNFRNQNRDVII